MRFREQLLTRSLRVIRVRLGAGPGRLGQLAAAASPSSVPVSLSPCKITVKGAPSGRVATAIGASANP